MIWDGDAWETSPILLDNRITTLDSQAFAAAYETGYFPIIHCGTSYGHYKEVREEIVHHGDLRDQVRQIMDKLGKPLEINTTLQAHSWGYNKFTKHRKTADEIMELLEYCAELPANCCLNTGPMGDGSLVPEEVDAAMLRLAEECGRRRDPARPTPKVTTVSELVVELASWPPR